MKFDKKTLIRIWPSACLKCKVKIIGINCQRNFCEDCRKEVFREARQTLKKLVYLEERLKNA